MANYTSLAIGINRYQYIQPLSYAQQDAQALHQLLVEETELPPEQALMLTDASPWIQNHATEPTRDNLHYWFSEWLPRQESDLLWFFFSGYGVSWQGEDYLMPIDGNPNDIPGTAVHLASLIRQIQQAGFAKILMLLDINRSPGVIAGQAVGEQLAQLAPEQGVSLVLSSQIDEAAHEHSALGHGIFTAALLEGLRYYAGPELTLDRLSHYLYERLPELSEHHWRPVQHPLIVIPSIEVAQEPLLPDDPAANRPVTGTSTPLGALATPPLPAAISATAVPPTAPPPVPPTVADDPDALPPELLPEPLDLPESAVMLNAAPPSEAETPIPDGSEPRLPPFGATPPPRSFAEALKPPPLPSTSVAPAPALADAEAEPTTRVPPAAPAVPPPQPTTAPAVPPPAPRRRPLTAKQQSWQLWGGLTILILAILGLLNLFRGRQAEPVVDVPPPAATSPETAADPPTPPASVDLPASPAASPAVTDASPSNADSGNANPAQAPTTLAQSQASEFSRAIIEAAKIPPDSPRYAEAQADIARWSAVILDIARGRANQGDFAGAIAAAQLIPQEPAPLHQEAQQQISQWQTQQKNVELIRTARRQIRHPQASSYSDAIRTLRQITAGQPGYSQAQERIRVWSEQIYLIANSRAARKEYKQAIETAKLVPQDTPSYDLAQQAIARWQQGD
ncbi:MAG: caspase family protein [Cyanobacteria bacterium P01_G01_bin.54]